MSTRSPSNGPGYLYSSLLVAALSASTGYILPVSNYLFLHISEGLCVLWVAIVIASVVRQGGRGLLTLIGLPLVVWWPVGLRLLVWLCNHGYNTCI
jgi:hypothetical protein